MMLLDRWANESKQMIAPALFTYEVTHSIYRHIGKGQLTFDEATLGLRKLFSIGVSLVFSDSQEISVQAIKIAHQFHLPASYDAHYLALAEHEGCEYWTDDTRLWNSVKRILNWVRWLGDYRP
jgi:predicted nucleic acid-binding protein